MKQLVKKSGIFFSLLCVAMFVFLTLGSAKAEAFFNDEEGTKQVQGDEGDEGGFRDGYEEEGEDEPEEKEEIKIKKISFSKKKLSGKTGEKIRLKPIIKPSNATNRKLSYSSSNKKVATVNSKGVVTLKKKGTVTITCKAKDGTRKKAKIKITVKKGKTVTDSSFATRTAAPAFGSKYYFSSGNIYYNYDRYAPTRNPFEGGRYCIGNCTWYACGRAWEILDKAKREPDLEIFGGNPYGIWLKNMQTKTYKTGKTPKVGALVVFGQKYGSYHIAVVEKIEGNEIYVSESAYRTKLQIPSESDIVFHYGNIEEWSRNREIIGYIYLLDE